MTFGTAAVLAAAFVQPWVAANDRAIARMHVGKTRVEQRAAFARTRAELRALESQKALRSAPEAKALARSILADHRRFRFAAPQVLPPKTLWQRIWEWIGKEWDALFKPLQKRLHLSNRTSAAIGDVLLFISVAGFLALTARLAWRYGRRREALAPGEPAMPGNRNLAQLEAAAREAAARASYNLAVTLLFGASLARLERARVFARDDARTAGETLRLVRARLPAAAQPLAEHAALVARAVYADAALGPAEWENAEAAYAAIVREVAPRSEADDAA